MQYIPGWGPNRSLFTAESVNMFQYFLPLIHPLIKIFMLDGYKYRFIRRSNAINIPILFLGEDSCKIALSATSVS